MKKFIVCVSIFPVIISLFVACGDKADDSESTTSSTMSHSISKIDPNYSTTKPQYTVGAVKTSEKNGTDNRAATITYYDENGFMVKEEIFENGKMVYYYTVSATDDMGNAIQVKYYTPNGKFVAAYDSGFFFDAKGNKMSETTFEALLGVK